MKKLMTAYILFFCSLVVVANEFEDKMNPENQTYVQSSCVQFAKEQALQQAQVDIEKYFPTEKLNLLDLYKKNRITIRVVPVNQYVINVRYLVLISMAESKEKKQLIDDYHSVYNVFTIFTGSSCKILQDKDTKKVLQPFFDEINLKGNLLINPRASEKIYYDLLI